MKQAPYRLTKPCKSCPFRTDVKPFLHVERVEEIRDHLVRGDFQCHNTLDTHAEDDESRITEDSAHCAGALILLEKLGTPSQMMRISGRLHMYDPTKLDMDAPVFESWEDMIDAQTD